MSFFDLFQESAIHLRLRRGVRLAPSEDRSTLVIGYGSGDPLPLTRYHPAFAPAVERLASGACASGLRDLVFRQGGVEPAARFALLLRLLSERGAVDYALVDETGERACLIPQRETFVPALDPVPDPSVPLDRFAFIRRDDGRWLLESPLVGARLTFADLGALDAPVVRSALAAAGFLEAAPKAGSPRREALRMWEFHDLAFHSHHRLGGHRDPNGGLFPYVDEIDPAPAVRPPWTGERIALCRVPDDFGRESFADVLHRRRSFRTYDEDHQISVADVGALLHRSARVRSVWSASVRTPKGKEAVFEASRRPYPSGGASYELELYLAVDRCRDLSAGLYHYAPSGHELVRISGPTPAVRRMLADAGTSTMEIANPQILVIVAARFARVMWKYRSIAYALILRHTGVLYQTFYLAATELGLAPCALGTGNSEAFSAATGLDPVIEGSVGEFLLGGRPSAYEREAAAGGTPRDQAPAGAETAGRTSAASCARRAKQIAKAGSPSTPERLCRSSVQVPANHVPVRSRSRRILRAERRSEHGSRAFSGSSQGASRGRDDGA